MLTLAIEQSTACASAALLRDGALVSERAWAGDRMRDQHTFPALRTFFEETGTALSQVDLFAVGLGPGAFSGIRIALATAFGMALPGGKPVDGVSSAAALAADVLQETGAPAAVVLGDARRGRVWLARFQIEEGDVVMSQSFSLVETKNLAASLQSPAALVTPHWDTLGPLLDSLGLRGFDVLRESRAPRARTVGELTIRQRQRAPPSSAPQPPPSPIYLHPPVFVPPRF